MHVRSAIWLAICMLALALGRDSFGWIPPTDDVQGDFGPWQDGEYANISWRAGHETLELIPAVPPNPGAGWIVPIPASPKDVTAAWENNTRLYSGHTEEWASEFALRQRLDEGFAAVWLTQIYPILFLGDFGEAYERSAMGDAVPPLQMDNRGGLGFAVPEISDANALKKEIDSSGIKLSTAEMEKLAALADGNHAFLFVYPPSVDGYKNSLGQDGEAPLVFWPRASPGLSIDFPSRSPLMPEYFCGNNPPRQGLNTIAIAGRVAWTAPPVCEPASAKPTIKWCRGSLYHLADYSHAATDEGNVSYTRVTYEGPQAEITFVPLPPRVLPSDRFDAFLVPSTVFWPIVIGWIALCSLVSSTISGLIVGGRRWHHFALAGLWNLATIAALAVVIERKKWRDMGIGWMRRRAFLALFAIIFAGLNVGLSHALTHWLGVWHF